MKCPGSTSLIARIAPARFKMADPEYLKDGHQAHELAAWCIENGADTWMADPKQFPAISADMMDAVQVYLNFVRSLPGDHVTEFKMHRPDFHELFYGTVDFAAVGRTTGLHIVDYKNGAGVAVEVDENEQMMYYGFAIIEDKPEEFDDDEVVTLTIVQPRCPHQDGPVRTWETTVGFIRKWAYEKLLPAMNDTSLKFDRGEHCRFCPAKLTCPAMGKLADDMLAVQGVELPSEMSDERLTELCGNIPNLRMLIKALEGECFSRMMAGQSVPGMKLVKKITHRQWLPEAQAALIERFGAEAWKPQELRSPPQVEALPGGKDFIRPYVFQPDGGLVVAPLSDKRRPQKPMSPEEMWGSGKDNS
jgi:hypothetical protein